MRTLLGRLDALRLLVPVFTLLAALGLVVLDAALAWYERRADLLQAGELHVRAAGAGLMRDAERFHALQPALLREEIGFIAADPEVVAVAIFDDEGRCLLAHEPTWAGRRIDELLAPAEAALGHTARGHRVARVLLREVPHPALVYLSGFRLPPVPGELRGQRQGLIYLRMEPFLPGFSTALLTAPLAIALPAVLIALLSLWFLQSRVVYPLRRLAEASSGFAQGGSLVLPACRGPIEIRAVIEAFSGMAERIRSQFAELQSRREFELGVLNALQEGVLVADPQGRILLANAAAQALFGDRCQPAQGGHLDRLFAQDTLSALGRGMDALSCRALHAKGVPFWAELQVWCCDAVEGPVQVLVVRDVTEARRVDGELAAHRDRLEELVESRTRELEAARCFAEQANQSKSDFLAAVSHEIRTPLNGVISLLELMGRTSLDAEQSAMLRVMQDSAGTLLTLISDMLDFSRIEAGRLDLASEPMSVETEASRVVETLDAIACERHVELRLRIDEDLPARVLGDPQRLRQILSNLLGNAIKFSSGLAQPGRVLLTVRCVSTEAGVAKVEFSVRDNGIGIRAQDRERLFAPFEQADAETSRRFGGTGLGLSIVRRLTEAMEGGIEVHSAPGLGSVFSVHLDLLVLAQDLPGYAPLAQVACVLVAPPGADAAFWERCLRRAGAVVEQVHDLDALALRRAVETSAPEVWVVLAEAADDARLDHLLDLRSQVSGDRPALLLLDAGASSHPVQREAGGYRLGTRLLTREQLVRAVISACAGGSASTTAAPSATAAADTSLKGCARVLVVDDSPTNRLVVERQLAALGYQTCLCDTAGAALDALKHTCFDLILSDLRMPGIDGFEFARRVRALEAERGGDRMPVIALTANALERERQRALDAGMDDCLTKPVTLERLRQTLQHWLCGDTDDHTSPAAGSRAEADVLDVLGRYLGDDPGVLRDYLQVLAAEMQAYPATLVDALRDATPGRIAMLAHQLKSSARSVGAVELARACESLERSVHAGTREALAGRVRVVEGQIRRTGAHLRRALAALGPVMAPGGALQTAVSIQQGELQ